MKTVRHCAVIALFLAVCATLTFADEPGRHPAYLHALTDLRHARAHLERQTWSGRMDREEDHAIAEIDKAIDEIKHAAIDDGKDLNDHPPVDAHLGHKGRYHRRLNCLTRRITTSRKKKVTALPMDCGIAPWNISTKRTALSNT